MRHLAIPALALIAAALGPTAARCEALTGTWGGDQAQLTLTAAGGTLVAGCAQGRLDGPITLGAHGRFKTAGAFEIQAPGPQRADEGPAETAATFSGAVQGQTLKLSVRSATGEQVYALTRGVRVKIIRCL